MVTVLLSDSGLKIGEVALQNELASSYLVVSGDCDRDVVDVAIFGDLKSFKARSGLSRSCFNVIVSDKASEDAALRAAAMDDGCNMVTHCWSSLETVLSKVARAKQEGGKLVCPTCGFKGLNSVTVW